MLINIFFGFAFLISVNSIFVDNLDRITGYNGKNDIFDTKYRLIFVFLGIFCYLFLNTIRHNRKIYYYKSRLYHINMVKKMMGDFYLDESDTKKEVKKINRILSLNKLRKRKIGIKINFLSLTDLFFSRIVYYRKICGGIWRKVHIIHEYKESRVKWVRENWKTSEKYWHEMVEAYGNENYEKSKNYKSFKYKLN